MEFEWDDEKEALFRAERGHGFRVPVQIFLGRTVEWIDDRNDYGEVRVTVAVVGPGERAMARMTIDDIRSSRSDLDERKLDATTEDDIDRCKLADGFDPKRRPDSLHQVVPPTDIRRKLGMTQQAFAAALRIPLATLRNWEQGRVLPDPAARSLLTIVACDPQAAFAALAA